MLDGLPDILLPAEVADVLRVSPRTLERWRDREDFGGLPYFYAGGEVRYEKAALIAYLSERRRVVRLNGRRRAGGGSARAEAG